MANEQAHGFSLKAVVLIVLGTVCVCFYVSLVTTKSRSPVFVPFPQYTESGDDSSGKAFYTQYLQAPTILDKKKSLAGIKDMVVFVYIDDKLCPGYDKAPLKTSLELELRRLGVKVGDKANASVSLCVEGFWNETSTQATYTVELQVREFVHTMRGATHIRMLATIWTSRIQCSVGRNGFSASVLAEIATCENELINDYMASNP